MDLRGYAKALRKQWLVVALITMLCLAAAIASTLATQRQYRAVTQLFVSTQGGADASQLQQGNSFTQQRVKSYADIVTSPRVLQPVIDALGLPTTTSKLRGSITAEAPIDTVLINVSVQNADPARAQSIADAVGRQFGLVIAELEKPAGAGVTPVRISVVQPADLPTSPVTPRVKLNLALGLLVGLALGIGTAVLRESLDTTVKNEGDVRALTNAPVLGGIAFDADTPARPLVVHGDQHSPRAEAFRVLRTNLQFVNLANRPRSIVVTSSVPGEGKSTTAANLAITLAAAGASVVLVDADLRRPKIAGYMGVEPAVGLTNVLIHQLELKDVLQPWGKFRLNVLTCGPQPPNPSELLGSQSMTVVLRELEARFDYVIVDTPPLLSVTDAAVVSRLAGGALVVAGSGKINRDQLARGLETLHSVDARVLGVLVNLLPTKGADAQGYYAYGYAPAEHPKPAAKAPGRRRDVRQSTRA